MSRKFELIDDDGNVLPPPDPESPVAQIIYLLEYGRLRGFRVGPTVQVGDVTVGVRDLRQERDLMQEARTEHGDLDPDSDMGTLLASDR